MLFPSRFIKVKDFSTLILLGFTILIGSLIFCRGFLLNRHIIKEKSTRCTLSKSLPTTLFEEEQAFIGYQNENNLLRRTLNSDNLMNGFEDEIIGKSWCKSSFNYQKIVILLLDAFRYDFIERMPNLHRILDQMRNEIRTESDLTVTWSCPFKFVADPPTTTMQRIKALMSGTMPTFIDASANFNSYAVEEDNLIYQLNKSGRKIAFLGDDTWLSLFPEELFTSPHVEAHPSFNAWDLDTVDRAVNSSIHKLFKIEHYNEWDVLIAHMLGIDHCGHRYGPAHQEMDRKLSEADKLIEFMYYNLPNDSLLVIFGDHGMTKTGDHGGDSQSEVDAALVILSKLLIRRKVPSSSSHESISSNLPTSEFINETSALPFRCHSTVNNPKTVSQIDFVPTFSSLIGIPIPFSSIGKLFHQFLPLETHFHAYMNNVLQVHRYLETYKTLSKNESKNRFEKIKVAYESLVDEDLETNILNSTKKIEFESLAEDYLNYVRQIALTTWTKFDLTSIVWGISICIMGMLCLTQLSNSTTQTTNDLPSWTLLACSSIPTFSVIINLFASTGLFLTQILTVLSLGIFLILHTSIFRRQSKASSIETSYSVDRVSFSNTNFLVSIIFYIWTCLGVFSNSFIINEGQILNNVFISLTFIRVFIFPFNKDRIFPSSTSTKTVSGSIAGHILKSKTQRGLLFGKKLFAWRSTMRFSFLSFLIVAIFIRVSSLFFRCREELQDCQEELLLHKHLSSLPEEWIVYKFLRFGIALLSVAVFVVIFREWIMVRKRLSGSRPAVLIGKYMPTLLIVLIGAHWALDGLPFSVPHLGLIRPALSYFTILYQSLTILAIIVLWLDPICIVCDSKSKVTERIKDEEDLKFRTETNLKCKQTTVNSYKLGNGSNSFSHNTLIGTNNDRCSSITINSSSSSKPESDSRTNVTCMKKNRKENFSEVKIGMENFPFEDFFTSSFLIHCVLITLLIIQIMSTGLAPMVVTMPYIVAFLANLKTISSSQDFWSLGILWTLASQYFFYATGHQPVFSSIPWDSAFADDSSTTSLGSIDGASSTLNWLRAGLAVIGNMFSSQIIFTICLPLGIYWNCSYSSSQSTSSTTFAEDRLKITYKFAGMLLILYGLKLLACMGAATYHRRHLMVWKIFAPRLIFEIVSFFIIYFLTIIILLYATRLDYLYQKIIKKRSKILRMPFFHSQNP